MRTVLRIGVIVSSASLLFCGTASCASAGEASAAKDQKSEPVIDLMGKKLRRGAANAGLGWLEVPGGVQEIGQKHGVGAAATWGVLHGAGRAVQRTAVGLFEIVTFPFALTQDYKPIIEPEFVLDPTKPAPAEAAPASAPEAS